MATRCCSARCSAERRGFRRELDSWRHKLIHCVGFESILEGIYGPRLLQDLSIFDNCEPETTSDWSTDVRCSFCNLQLDRISDCSPDSPPRAETPPQGLNNSDTLQCQADRFLHAVLHKKEFPESCDPIIPLAAQELMRKMIRQFAVEYAHKIQTAENQNVLTQTEPDGPLDLTLSRNTNCAHQVSADGVLDLSKKTASSVDSTTQQRLSGCLWSEEDELRTEEEGGRRQRCRPTALEEVMSSVCSRHRTMLSQTLREIRSFASKDRRAAATPWDVKRSCCARRRILVDQRPRTPSPPPLSPKPPDLDCRPCLETETAKMETENEESSEHTPGSETPGAPKPVTDSADKCTEQERVCDDTHLTEIITTVLHSSRQKDYDLKQLFEQHLASEKHTPRTRAQKRREVLQAISRPHDQPASRRQSLQIKRDLARLNPATCGRSSRKRKVTDVTETRHDQNSQNDPQSGDTSGAQTEKSERYTPCVIRLRRNIVKPHRFTSYITEPKKMFYTAQVSDAAENLNAKANRPSSSQNRTDVQPHPKRPRTVRANDQTQPDSPTTDRSTGTVQYTSPIKLMLVSSVKGKHGVKYTLRTAHTNPHEGAFDPCVEASWAGSGVDEQAPEHAGTASDDETIPVAKRRPGRPKKFKAQPEKAEKRPIGRPPKSKPEPKQAADETSVGEDGNKNLQITITYGRRKARRVVSENLKTEQGGDELSLTEKPEFSLVTPVEDGNINIRRPKQTGGVGMRKPGRPAKVKISGISVTVTTRSPRRRKIHVEQETTPDKPEPPGKQQAVTSVRHSARERRPSIHLQNCVGMPSHRLHKLPQNKADQMHERLEFTEVKDTSTLSDAASKEGVRFSELAVDPIFGWDASLRWWPTSASPDALEKELDRRIGVMTETWVSEPDLVSSSSVRMLFERKCDKETLSSWFMQTTETQSLAIVKKANTRNAGEIFRYSSVRTRSKARACSSPQAERLRKHLKKFAKVVPKSLAKLRRAQEKIRRRLAERPLFSNQKTCPGRAWRLYRASLKRAKTQLKIRTKKRAKRLNDQMHEERSGPEDTMLQLNTTFSQRDAWSSPTLRECRVFLRKLTSSSPLSRSEKCDDCTVRVSVSVERELGISRDVTLEKSRSRSAGPTDREVNRKRRPSCMSTAPPEPRRPRSSRGVMAARWSDFIIGPAR